MAREPLLGKVIGSLEGDEFAAKVRDMDLAVSGHSERATRGLLGNKPWSHISHVFGYIPPGMGKVPIQSSGSVQPDETLIGARIVVRIDRIYVEEYPGFGEHSILLTFKGQNQTQLGVEPACFSRTYRARDRESVATKGQPIFVGLTVGAQGIGFECATVNVKSAGDAKLLAGLGSADLNSGLELLAAAQPVLAQFAQMTLGLAKFLAGRSSNAAVQDFYLGLDFDAQGTGARLREGSYVAMQAPDGDAVDWKDWVFDMTKQAIVGANDPTSQPYYNHIIFRVSRHKE